MSQLIQNGPSVAREFPRRIRSMWFHMVNQVVDDPDSSGDRCLGGAYVKAAIYLNGIEVDDVGAKALRQAQCQGALARRGRSDDDYPGCQTGSAHGRRSISGNQMRRAVSPSTSLRSRSDSDSCLRKISKCSP